MVEALHVKYFPNNVLRSCGSNLVYTCSEYGPFSFPRSNVIHSAYTQQVANPISTLIRRLRLDKKMMFVLPLQFKKRRFFCSKYDVSSFRVWDFRPMGSCFRKIFHYFDDSWIMPHWNRLRNAEDQLLASTLIIYIAEGNRSGHILLTTPRREQLDGSCSGPEHSQILAELL